ncbi:hypothetical protein ElyMa_004325100 [Elysia marginata]|uniref:Uncharacterized protein n=1 Tax=Elysia marginata TaxID=1093978 RepID=A0AAV4H0V4_9GAST|nr:hypothetical protein ElyMa_004325100 [Elysia marginata]
MAGVKVVAAVPVVTIGMSGSIVVSEAPKTVVAAVICGSSTSAVMAKVTVVTAVVVVTGGTNECAVISEARLVIVMAAIVVFTSNIDGSIVVLEAT